MKISVIIPTLNEEKRIANLLKDLHQQTVKPHEIFVIDAKSKDNTRREVQRFKKVIFHELHPGVGYQRHFGAQQASGELFIFLDADTRVEKTFLKKIQQQMILTNNEVACPRYFPYKSTRMINGIYQVFNRLFWVFQKVSPSGAGSCIIATNTAYKSAGGFDGTLTYDDIAFIRIAGRKHGFRQIPVNVFVSDRRFREYGIPKMMIKYAVLSCFFFFGQFRLANLVDYKFGDYKKDV